MTWPAHDARVDARALLEDPTTDPRAQRVAAALLEHLAADVDRAARRPLHEVAAPPPCPSCGRRFASAHRTGRHPLHGPTAARCPSSRTPAEDRRVPVED